MINPTLLINKLSLIKEIAWDCFAKKQLRQKINPYGSKNLIGSQFKHSWDYKHNSSFTSIFLISLPITWQEPPWRGTVTEVEGGGCLLHPISTESSVLSLGWVECEVERMLFHLSMKWCEEASEVASEAISDESSEFPRQGKPTLCCSCVCVTVMFLYHHGNNQYTRIPWEARAALWGAVVQAGWEEEWAVSGRGVSLAWFFLLQTSLFLGAGMFI